MNKCILIALLLLCRLMNTMAQDVESVLESPSLQLSGGINVNNTSFGTTDTASTRQANIYAVNAHLNGTFLGVVDIPVSFAYSNREVDSQYALPFNRFTLNPSYKWVKTYIGYNTLSFSPYTLSGHEFMGFGTELTPNSTFNFSFMHGRLRKANPADSTNPEQAMYKRMGVGFKTQVNFEKIKVGLILFHAQDDENSLPQAAPGDSTLVRPQDNLAGSINLSTTLIKNVSLDLEYSFSALNQNTIDPPNDENDLIPDFLLESKTSLALYEQIKFGINYKAGSLGSIGIAYERVDPNYRTLGAHYFTNDFENINFNISTKISSWLQLSSSIGVQKDNLEEQKSTGSERTVFSLNANIKASKKLNLTASYSNFQSYTYVQPLLQRAQELTGFENVDTLNFTQINQSFSLGGSYALSSTKKKSQNINLNLSFQQSGTENGLGQKQGDRPSFLNSSTGYSMNLPKQNFGLSVSANYNQSNTQVVTTQLIGASINVRKKFFNKKVSSSFSTSLSNPYTNGQENGMIINNRANASYTFHNKHNFSLNISLVSNNSPTREVTELTATLTYSYNFGASIAWDGALDGDF